MAGSRGKKKLHVSLFDMACVSHVAHGLWVAEDNNRHRFNELGFWIELAQIAERGLLDMIFLADVTGVYDHFRASMETALAEALQIPSNDPLSIVPAMAAVTRHIGFGVTFSTSYDPPFSFARRMSTLDHLTDGRMAWNIVTSYLRNAAENFGLSEEIPHDQRYEIAQEFIDVVYKLWEGSWDEDAVVRDAANNVYIDPAKVRRIDHIGPRYRVAGPHLCQPSPQRTPLLVQATGSPAGLAFAARNAEVLFIVGMSPTHARDQIKRFREDLRAMGRDPDSMKFVVGAVISVGRTVEEAEAKLTRIRSMASLDAYLAHFQSAYDLRLYPRDMRIGDIVTDRPGGYSSVPSAIGLDDTVGQVIDRLTSFSFGNLTSVGTPQMVADDIEHWIDECGVDGINLFQQLSFGTVTDFVELVIPELQRRGRFRTSYEDGETLRERFFGAGCRRLPGAMYGAGFRRMNTHEA
jgi:FMN-dependent oxidoreductase (nitrilotriacetate monooxygenase family)